MILGERTPIVIKGEKTPISDTIKVTIKMASLRLINNPGLDTEKNLCFVNAALQLLYSLSEVRDFLYSKSTKQISRRMLT